MHQRKRGMLRFNLRMMLAAVSLLACLSCWISMQLKWKHARHAAWEWIAAHEGGVSYGLIPPRATPGLPWGLRLVGETPLDYVPVAKRLLKDQQDIARFQQIQELFPEARAVVY